MATLAAMFKQKGFYVQGSDKEFYPPMREFLVEQKILMLEGYRADHISDDIDFVVIGNAVSRGNPEVEEVLDRKIHYFSLPEAIRDHFLWGRKTIVAAGTHGKTTTASLIGWLLAKGNLDPSLMVGGIALNFGTSFRVGSGSAFVIEGDEYDSAFFDKTAKFLKYIPDIVIINNVEFDHADIYPDLDSIRVAFRRLITLIPRGGLLILGGDSQDALDLGSVAHCKVETFGLSDSLDWQAKEIAIRPSGTKFNVYRRGSLFERVEVPLLGAFNVRNVIGSIAAASAVGLTPGMLAEGLSQFRGVRRRLELRGTVGGINVYDDFAHHPTAVEETLKAVKEAYPGRRLWAVFEPRSATACSRVFESEISEALSLGDEVILGKVFRSKLVTGKRLSENEVVSELILRGTHAKYIPEVKEIITTVVNESRDGDVVVIMSNGNFEGIHGRLLKALREKCNSSLV